MAGWVSSRVKSRNQAWNNSELNDCTLVQPFAIDNDDHTTTLVNLVSSNKDRDLIVDFKVDENDMNDALHSNQQTRRDDAVNSDYNRSQVLDVAPVISNVKVNFVLKRWLNTCLGGASMTLQSLLVLVLLCLGPVIGAFTIEIDPFYVLSTRFANRLISGVITFALVIVLQSRFVNRFIHSFAFVNLYRILAASIVAAFSVDVLLFRDPLAFLSLFSIAITLHAISFYNSTNHHNAKAHNGKLDESLIEFDMMHIAWYNSRAFLALIVLLPITFNGPQILLFRSVWALFPIFYAFGIAPSSTTFLDWLLERVNIDLFSGTASGYRLKSVKSLFFSIIIVIGIVLIIEAVASSSIAYSEFICLFTIPIASLFGFAMSINIFTHNCIKFRIMAIFTIMLAILISVSLIVFIAKTSSISNPSFLINMKRAEICIVVIALFIWMILNQNPSQVYRIATLIISTIIPFIILTMNISLSRISESNSLFNRIISIALLFRAYRSIWQYDRCAVHGTPYLIALILKPDNEQDDWQIFMFRVFTADLIINRLIDALSKLHFAIVHSLSALYRSEKLRVRKHNQLKVIVYVLIPFHIIVIVISSILMTPIVPLFGLPIFFIAYPRPLRGHLSQSDHENVVKPDQSSESIEQVLYDDIIKSLQLHIPIQLLHYCRAGDMYLVRLDKFIVWIQVLERGFGYVQMQFKGLEMQATTDCHAVEASRIDEIIVEHSTFTWKRSVSQISTLWSIVDRIDVNMPSITISSLTGIVDNSEFASSFVCALKLELLRILTLDVQYELVESWSKRIPFLSKDLLPHDDLYPTDFVETLMKQHNLSNGHIQQQKQVWLSCLIILLNLKTAATPNTRSWSISRITKLFRGKIPISIESNWITDQEPLQFLVIQSARRAFKIAYDAIALMDQHKWEWSRINEHSAYIMETLIDVATNWRIGWYNNHEDWIKCVKIAVQSDHVCAFALMQDRDDIGSLKCQLINRSVHNVVYGKLNSSSVFSLWAGLEFDLLYATHDDEERYAIQAHPYLLRNLTIQAAPPPLGYSVYTSSCVNVDFLL